MDWTVRPPLHTTLYGTVFQVQGQYHSQQPAYGFSQASTSTQNPSGYSRNDQVIKIHSSTENIMPNQQSSQNNVGSNSFQPPLQKSTVPVTGSGTTQHFVGQQPHMQLPGITVQMTPGMAKNSLPNSNFLPCSTTTSPVAPQRCTANPLQTPPNWYIASGTYNNQLYNNRSNSVRGSFGGGYINSSCPKKRPVVAPKYQPANPQTHVTVLLNQVPSHFLNSQQNSSCLTFPSGQNIQNQIKDINSGSATAMQSQQYTIPNHYATQAIPQATNANPLPPYPVPPSQINHGQIVLPQPATNTSDENVQNPQNLELDQSSVSYSVQHVQIPQSVSVSRETNEVGVADSPRGHSTENHPSNELTASEALKSICNSFQLPGTVPFDKTSTPQTTRSMVEDNASKSSGNVHDSLIKCKKSLELDKKQILAMIAQYSLKRKLYLSVAQKSETSDPSVHNPDLSLPAPNISQQPAPPPQATNQTFSLPSHNATHNLSSLLPYDNAQNCPPSILASSSSQTQNSSLLPRKRKRPSEASVCNTDLLPPTSNTSQQPAPLSQATHPTFSLLSHNGTQNLNSFPHDNAQNHPLSLFASSASQTQDSSLLPQKKRSRLKSILKNLLKGTCDEAMLFNTYDASTERNQSKQLFSQEKCFFDSVLDSRGVKSATNMNDMKRESRLSPNTSQIVPTQESLTSTDVTWCFEQTSALGKYQITNKSAMCGGDLFNDFVLNKEKLGTTVTKILTNSQSTVPIQNSVESSQLSEKLAEAGSRNSLNTGSEVVLQSKDNCLQTPDKSITAWNNGNDTCSSASLAATVPEAGIVQSSLFMGNSCTMSRTCSLEELETSLALWRKSPAVSSNDQLGESTKSTMCSSSLDRVKDKEMEYTMKNFPNANALTHCEKSSIAVGKNESVLSSVSSSFGQKPDAVSSSPSKNSEPQIAIVPPLIFSKEGIQNEVQENDLCSILDKIYPVIKEGGVRSLHEFILTLSDTDKPVKRTACSPPDSHVTVKEVDSDMHQKTVKSSEENGIQRAGSATACSCDPNQRVTDPLELKTNTPQLYSRDSFPPETNKDSSSPVSQECAPETSPDLVEQEDTVLNENMFQISSVCTLVQGDAFYNSQIANIFNNSSKAEHNTSSEDQRPDSYNKEQQLSHWKKESEMNGSTSVEDVLIPSLGILSKAIAEKLLSLPGLKIPQGGKVSDEVNVRKSEEEKNIELVNPNCEKGTEQNMLCNDVYSRDLASRNEEVPSFENQVHSENSIGMALTLPNDQLTELLKEFPYGIDGSKTLKKTEIEDSPTKVNEIKDGQETETCGQNSEGNHALEQITVTILNPQQIKELFPEFSSQLSDKLENENDKLTIASENTNKSHLRTVLIENTNTSKEKVQKPFCCTQGWLALKYSVDPCEHMLGKDAALKTSSTDCQLNNQQQTLYDISNNLPSEVKSDRILIKTFACRESDLQEKASQLLKEDNAPPCPFLKKLETLKSENEELPEKVHIDELCSQKCTTLVSKSQEQLYSGTDDSEGESLRSACKRDSSYKERTPKDAIIDKSKSDTLRHRRMKNKHSKKPEKYKIKHDSSETHIIKGPTKNFKRLKKHHANEDKMKTKKRPCSTVTNRLNISNVDLGSKAHNNAQHSQEHLNRRKCEIERDLEDEAVRSKHGESSSSVPVEQNKASLARTNLKKYAYSEERGTLWKNRSPSEHNKTSKVQTSRGQFLNMYKARFAKAFSDKKSSCNRKSNTLTLQREQKKNYLNKVAFKQTEQSICLTKLEQSPSKSVWHVKSSSVSEHLEDTCSQQSDAVKPQMLEFKMCPEIVFRNLVSEDVSDAEKLPEKERTPVSAVKSRREDWLNYTPWKRRKTDEKETKVDQIPLDTAMEVLDKNEAIKNSNATFETYRKMHLEKSRSLDSSPIN